MSENPNPLAVQQGNPQAEQQPAAQQEPKYVTIEELERRIAEVKKEALDHQSRLGKRIQQKLDALRQAGVPNADETMAKALVEAEEKQTSEAATSQDAQPAAGNSQTSAQSLILNTAEQWMKEDGINQPDPITRDAFIIMATAGVHITDDDPEINLIVADKEPQDFLNSVRAAVKAKQDRTQNSASKPASVPTFAKGAPGGNPPHASLSAAETLENYFKSKQ